MPEDLINILLTHPAALERTFLAYIRTASAFATFGVAAAQLFRLQGTLQPSLISTFFQLGKPLGAAAEAVAIVVTLVGGLRCWKQQQKILGGHVAGGGWELYVISGVMFAVCCRVLACWFGFPSKPIADITALKLLVVLLVLIAGDASSEKPA